MTNLHAAAERLRRLKLYGGSESYDAVYPDVQPRHVDDMQAAAKHLVETVRGDDGEAITAEWLGQFANVTVERICAVWVGSNWETRWGFRDRGSVTVPDETIKTRGDLRLLCRALGIPLQDDFSRSGKPEEIGKVREGKA